MNIDLKTIKTVHFIGIGGIGVSAIARMMMLEGKKVSGSDSSSSLVTDELSKLGAEISVGHDASHIPDQADLVVYTIAVSNSNPELAKALELGIPTLSYPETLGLISKDKYTIAVAGTHGKTTTTGMLAKVFIDAGLDPTVIIGSFLKEFKSNFIAGQSKYFIAEACEYRRSFLNLYPKVLVITNIEEDHLDYYQDLADIQSAFRELAERVPVDGFVVCNQSDKNLQSVVEGLEATVLDYSEADVQGLKLQFPGAHLVEDAQVVLSVAKALTLDLAKTTNSLNNFSGTWRRFDYRGETKTGALVYDDYAHHPQEIAKTLQAVKEKHPEQKLVVVFQPHLFSRTKQFLKDFAQSLRLADEVIVLPIYAAREIDDGKVSHQDLVSEIQALGGVSSSVNNFAEVIDLVNKKTNLGDIVFVLGAGDVTEVSDVLVGLS